MYKLNKPPFGRSEPNSVYRLLDDAIIPIDEANTDYQEYLAWVAEGNTATEWQPEA